MKTIVMKELREHARWLPIGLLLVSACLLFVTPIRLIYAGNFGVKTSELLAMTSLSSGLFAILLGAAQSWFDFSQRQRGFLFHRPYSRNQILYGKVCAAAILYAIACMIPLGCVALWFAYSGPLYLPVRPAQTLPALIMCILCFSLHPITMFTIEREARWIGTRLLPLLGAAVALFAIALVLLSASRYLFDEIGYLLLILGFAAFAGWTALTLRAKHPSRNTMIGLGAFVLVVWCAGICASLTEAMSSDVQYIRTAMDESGNLWSYRYKSVQSLSGYQEIPLSGEQLRSDSQPDLDQPLPKDFVPHGLTLLNDLRNQTFQDPFINYTRYQGMETMLSDSRGFILVYDNTQHPPLKGTLSRSGFHRSDEGVGQRFSREPVFLAFPKNYVADSLFADFDGIYQFNQQTATMEPLSICRLSGQQFFWTISRRDIFCWLSPIDSYIFSPSMQLRTPRIGLSLSYRNQGWLIGR